MKLRKWILALAALLISSGAQAHVSAIPFPEIGSLDDVTHHAAFSIIQTALPSRIQKNLVTDYGATCNGVADDSAAFQAFKAAFQGAIPVQLNLPGMCTYNTPSAGSNLWIFRGIQDYIIDGGGVGGIKNTTVVSQALFLGGVGQFADNNNSLRTNTATAGDSCVTVKTVPAVTVSAIADSLPSPATFTATVSASGVLDVTAVSSGTLVVGQFLYRSLGLIGNPTTIKSQLTGSAGGIGTYQLSNSPLASQVASLSTPSTFTSNGPIRVTLNSTTGLTSGDTLYLTGVTGTGQLPNLVNGLQWIKVVNGTQIDLFQRPFSGSYTSGGTGGGDRTALMPTGSKVLMTGWNNQSYWAQPYSFPSNPHWFEFKTVSSTNSTTHQICFDTPLADAYKSTWPQMNTGSQFEVDPGGPATLYLLLDWELTAVFQNLTIDSTLQSYSQGRNVTFKNAVVTGAGCPIPTQNETFTYLNVTGTNCTMETDKIVKTWNITNSTLKKIHLQSSSIDTINIDGLTVATLNGTPKRLFANNLTTTCSSFCTPGSTTDASFQVGTGVYGVTDEVVITNSSIATPAGSTAGNGLQYSVPFPDVNDPNRSWSMSGGVITIPNGYSWNPCCGESELQIKTIVPGHYVFWRARNVGRALKIVDVTQDVDNIYVQTSEAGGFPTGAWTAPTSGIIQLIPHPAPKFTMTNVTGALSATLYNGCPAQAPIFSCANISYTDNSTGASTEGYFPELWGVIDTFTFTNNVPYTNTGALTWKPSRFDNWQVLKTDLTYASFGTSPNGQVEINMKLPSPCGSCTRTLTSSGGTNTQVGDTLTAPPGGALFGGALFNGPIFSANTPSDSPQVTATYRTNQNLP